MYSAPANVLWLDDEFGTERESGLTPWKRELNKAEKKGRLKVRPCGRLDDFARLLEAGAPHAGDTFRAFDLLIIDVMLNLEVQTNYEPLGFDEELVIQMEAGAQIAGLIRGSLFDGQRPNWLAAYRHVPLLVLSSSPEAPRWVAKQVGSRRMESVRVVVKALQTRSDGQGVDASKAFLEAVDALLPG